ncbi:hypothetical protein KJ781_04220 [Patescibacteria group bacterium]|nr:hypothetical protein [Patescibacteria group bacterium]MBU2613605.1 hypothetical protein [Patescibacteria group bacterium]
MPKAPPPMEAKELTTEERHAEQLAAWLKDHPPQQVVPPELRKESGEMVEQFRTMVSSFESDYPLAELHAVIDLTPAEAPNHPVREPARKAIIPILTLLKSIENETDISAQNLQDLKSSLKRLSQAVGMINSGKVDHTR